MQNVEKAFYYDFICFALLKAMFSKQKYEQK